MIPSANSAHRLSPRAASLLLWATMLAGSAGCGDDDNAGGGGDGAATTTHLGGAGGTGGTGEGGTGGEGTAGGGGSGPACVDTCPAPNGGVEWECRTRFMYGVNYAWEVFAGDFGGIPDWGQGGVVANEATHAANLAAMRNAGVSTIRWWMFPDFRGGAIEVDGTETVTGLGSTALADLNKALELADQADVYLMLCLFSFDAFRPSQDVSGIWTPGLAPMARSDAKRAALLEQVLRPIAQAVESSPYRRRMVAWDVMNEPEWAMTGSSLYGDPDFTPDGALDPITHAEMEDLLAETIAVLRAESGALVTVGGAAAKWQNAWTGLDLDFYQLHTYEWVNEWWPYTTPASDYGLGKPLVMGEMPMTDGGLGAGISHADVLASFWNTGYAGALGWMYNGASQAELDNLAAFAAQHPCETHYSPLPTQRRTVLPAAPRPVGARGRIPSLRPCTRDGGRPVCRTGY